MDHVIGGGSRKRSNTESVGSPPKASFNIITIICSFRREGVIGGTVGSPIKLNFYSFFNHSLIIL